METNRCHAAAVAAVFVLCGCAASRPEIPPPVKAADTGEVVRRVFLIGDAGEPAAGGEPVLMALTSEIEKQPSPAHVVFLGDNVYEDGMPAPSAEDRAEAERRLGDQLDAVLATDAVGIVVPGNHDWHGDGWEQVLHQQRFVDAYGGDRIVFEPRDGCPGPVAIDVGERLRLVVLDTHWWLHDDDDKPGPGSDCVATTPDEVVHALSGACATAGDRHVVVLAHHPLLSTGPHGGHFTWKDHLFPLTKMADWAWVPLPIIGSIYPLSRKWGITSQDLSNGSNKAMREALDDVLVEHAPLVYAAGHEHVLEVLGGRSARYILVSGSGIYGHTEPVGWRDESLYAASLSGFMRLDFLEDGRVRLGVFVVEADASANETYAIYLE